MLYVIYVKVPLCSLFICSGIVVFTIYVFSYRCVHYICVQVPLCLLYMCSGTVVFTMYDFVKLLLCSLYVCQGTVVLLYMCRYRCVQGSCFIYVNVFKYRCVHCKCAQVSLCLLYGYVFRYRCVHYMSGGKCNYDLCGDCFSSYKEQIPTNLI